MAVVLCRAHSLDEGRSREFIHPVEPKGYPEAATLCGSANCEAPGLLWLDADELADYERGVRVFHVASDTIKVGVE